MRNLLFILSFTFFAPFFSKSQQKHALIFAAGNYPPRGGWSVISSITDVAYVSAVLSKQGFEDDNIRIFLDSAVTPEGIENAFYLLNKRINPGDIILIYFSTHGEQIEDDNDDESDGYDESIVTFNAVAPDPLEPSKNFKISQKEYVRDDRIGWYISQLRSHLGKKGDIAVFMDLCHSGSGTRGTNKVRGNKMPLVSSAFDPQKHSRKDTAGVFREKTNSAGDGNNLSSVVIFSAARAEELDYETTDDNNQPVGSLTYAFAKAFQKLESTTTYRSLFARIQSVMNGKVPGQHPVLEGNGTDRMLFGGNFVCQKPYAEIESATGNEIIIKAGLLAGLDTGTKVVLYNAGTAEPGKAILLDSGKVTKSGMYKATVSLTKAFGDRQVASIWVFLTDPSYNTKPINIKTEGFSQEEIVNIKEDLKNLPQFQFKGDPELIFSKGAGADYINIASNGHLFDSIKREGLKSIQLQKKFQNYSQYKFLSDLEIKDSAVNIQVKLVPMLNGKADTAKINERLIHGVYEYKEGDKMVLWVKNTGTSAAYFNILDMQPDGIINPILPNRKQNIYASDLRIEAGSERVFDKYVITITPPYGMEIFKVFSSTEAIDLELIANSKGTIVRSNFKVLENLVKKSYSAAARGAFSENIGGANGSCYNIIFSIQPN